MIPNSLHNLVRQPGNEGQEFVKIARRVSETIGSEFFTLLVNRLAEVVNADSVYIAEFVGDRTERVRTLAIWTEGGGPKTFEFPLAGSPDAETARGSPCTYARRVRETFPEDHMLRDLEAEAWTGVPLNNPEGQACGVIAALYRQPLELEIDFVQSMLTTFVPRASAELSRKQADDILRESEERYRAYVQMNPDGCWRIEFDEPIDTALPEEEQLAEILRSGHIAECNDALVKMLGLDRPDQLIGAAVTEAVNDAELTSRCLRDLISSGYRYGTLEVTTLDRKGKRHNFSHSHWGIVENGTLQRIWVSTRDITELRGIEAQFRHVQRLDSLGRLAAGVAHDFNNLLTVIQGYAAQLLERAEKSDNAYIGLAEIVKASEKGAALTKQLLAFSRKQSVEPQLLDLKRIVQEDEQMLRRLIGKNIELKTDLESSVGLVRADAGYLHQVLLNLTVNARDAMPNGGRLLITLSNSDVGETRPPRLTPIEPGPYVRLSVDDNGVGMSPDVQAHLFEPFFTTKEGVKGTGLGLSTVYGIVRQSGGYIFVETEANKGTTFEIFFPRESSQGAAGLTGRPKPPNGTDP
jgi:PAS domain S-box-containing protein